MDEEKREARRKMLAELERAWDDTPRPPAESDVTAQSVTPPSAEMQAALDAAADRLVESLDPPPVSVPSMDELDSGWEAEEDENDEEDEHAEPEPDLPDESLDPVAYATAKKAREDRAMALRERRRVKAEAKKARRKARAEAQKSKQKAKAKKPRPPAVVRSAKEQHAQARSDAAAHLRRAKASAAGEDPIDDDAPRLSGAALQRAKVPPSRLMASKPMLSGTNTWMLGIAVAIFLAAAVFVAVITR